MKKHPYFRPLVGSYWTESLSDDELILNELKRLKIPHHLRRSKADLTIFGKNKRLVLRHLTGQAILIWEKQLIAPRKFGIRCVLFINNSQAPTKDLLLEGMKFARLCWIEYPFFTYLNPRTHPKNADSIFLECGWDRVISNSKEGLLYKSEFMILR